MKINVKKALVLGIVLFYLLGTLAFFVSAYNVTFVKDIIQKKIPCSELNRTQLIDIGDYYMSQVFSPEQHEYMDNMMGGDSSPMAEQMHISFAYRYYCNPRNVSNVSADYDSGYPGYGMMGGYGPGMMRYDYGNYHYTPWYDQWWFIAGISFIFAFLTAAIVVLAIKLSRKNSHKRRK